jgi:hypothetical protein
MRTPILPTLLVSLLLLAAVAPSAGANASDDRIVHDCQHSITGELTGRYDRKALQHALHNLPTDVREYTNCFDAIRQALLAPTGGANSGDGSGLGAGGLGGTGGGGLGGIGGAPGGAGAAPPATPAHLGAETAVAVAGTPLRPGTIPTIGRDAHELPGALIALLVLLGVAGIAGAATTVGQRVLARRDA